MESVLSWLISLSHWEKRPRTGTDCDCQSVNSRLRRLRRRVPPANGLRSETRRGDVSKLQLAQSLGCGPAGHERRAIAETNRELGVAFGGQRLDEIEVHNMRAMHPEEMMGVQTTFQFGHRHLDKESPAARDQRDVVAISFQTLHF